MRRLLLILSLVALTGTLAAQRMAPAHFSGHWSGPRDSGFGRTAFRGAGYALPFFDPLFFAPDYISSAGYPAPSQPAVIVVQSQPQPVAAEPAAPPAQPLMIELQGDHYVQISGDEVSHAQMQMIDRVPATQITSRSAVVVPTSLHRSSTVLVFRDGHREEVSDYTIADGVLYAAADYYGSGMWSRKIVLSSLNLPETVASNQGRAVPFRVPTAANEVVVGP